MVSHAGFLRQNWGGDDADFLALVRGLYAEADRVKDLPTGDAVEALRAIASELPGLDDDEREVLRYVARLTVRPRDMSAADLERLRAAGFEDRAIHDINHVANCFAYMNRLADGLGVTLLQSRHALARELFGADAVARHVAWGAGG